MRRFEKSKQIGEVWESGLETWLRQRFSGSDWIIDDARDFHRDPDGDQVPDYIIYNTANEKYHFIDAKKRNAYESKGVYYFGFDEKLLTSYRNISKKFGVNVYVGFNDPKYDPDHVYILNVNQQHSWKPHFDNEHGKSYAYRWKVSDLKRYKLHVEVNT